MVRLSAAQKGRHQSPKLRPVGVASRKYNCIRVLVLMQISWIFGTGGAAEMPAWIGHGRSIPPTYWLILTGSPLVFRSAKEKLDTISLLSKTLPHLQRSQSPPCKY